MRCRASDGRHFASTKVNLRPTKTTESINHNGVFRDREDINSPPAHARQAARLDKNGAYDGSSFVRIHEQGS